MDVLTPHHQNIKIVIVHSLVYWTVLFIFIVDADDYINFLLHQKAALSGVLPFESFICNVNVTVNFNIYFLVLGYFMVWLYMKLMQWLDVLY